MVLRTLERVARKEATPVHIAAFLFKLADLSFAEVIRGSNSAIGVVSKAGNLTPADWNQ